MVKPNPKTPATIIAISTYVIVSGIFTQSGVILGPAATYFHAGLADTAVLFSYLNAGNLGGILASLFAFSIFTIRQVLFAAYVVFFLGVALIDTTHSLHTAFAAAVLTGFGAGTGLSAGAVIISKTYANRRRAIAFLGTDCAFSVAGYIVPSLVGFVIAAGWRWQSGYLLVAVLPVILLAASLWIRFPSVSRTTTPRDHSSLAPSPPSATGARSAYLRVALFSAGLSLYLTGQNIFTIWAPTYLQAQFGIPALQAGGIVGTFFGASSFGLITAALLVTRVSPRAVLAFSISMGVLLTLLLARAPNAALFFGLTTAFGFTSTCMFKLMISIGSEQIPASPPQLVTFLLLCSGLGGIAAPALSAPAVKAFGPHAGLDVCALAYAAAFAFIIAALVVEKNARSAESAAVSASAA